MKKTLIVISIFFLSTLFFGCNKKTKNELDFSDMNYNIITSMNFEMAVEPEKFYGKNVKMRGQFFSFTDPESSERFYSCVVYDPTACCQAGIDFMLSGDQKYPEDYPAEETFIEIEGPYTDFSNIFTDGRSYAGILCDKITVLNQ